jgi:hypothetical protein
MSSANIVGSDKTFILGGKYVVCTTKSKGSSLDPWRNACFRVPYSEKKIWASLGDFISTSWFLSVKYYLNQYAPVPWMP